MIKFTWEDEDGEGHEEELPSKFEVCSRCEGYGTHLHPDIGSHCYTAEEFNEAFDDDESRAAYFQRGGIYDVQCIECEGLRVVSVVDEEACQGTPKLMEILKKYNERQKFEAQCAADDAAIRRMESGGYE